MTWIGARCHVGTLGLFLLFFFRNGALELYLASLAGNLDSHWNQSGAPSVLLRGDPAVNSTLALEHSLGADTDSTGYIDM